MPKLVNVGTSASIGSVCVFTCRPKIFEAAEATSSKLYSVGPWSSMISMGELGPPDDQWHQTSVRSGQAT